MDTTWHSRQLSTSKVIESGKKSQISPSVSGEVGLR